VILPNPRDGYPRDEFCHGAIFQGYRRRYGIGRLSASARFNVQRVDPSTHPLESLQIYLDPICSELSLLNYAREKVENPVQTSTERSIQ
jgi:hypothetical protein